MWKKIAELCNEHTYMSEVVRDETRVKATAEVFTPTELVIHILQNLLASDSHALDPGKTVLDPACGDGQFLVAVKWYKILHHGMSEADALKDIYGVDIMRDNVDLCKRRLNGGNIIMGDTLNPTTKLKGQKDHELQSMLKWFTCNNECSIESFFV